MDGVSDWMMKTRYVEWEIIRDDTIHVQIIMIRYRMRWIVDSLSWWIGVQLIITHSILHQQSNNHFNLSPCIHIEYDDIVIHYLISLIHIILSYPLIIVFIIQFSSSIMNKELNELIWITQYPWFKRMTDKMRLISFIINKHNPFTHHTIILYINYP